MNIKLTHKIIYGDCIETLKNMDDNSIDLILTDPPYGLNIVKNSVVGHNKGVKSILRNYGNQEWDKERLQKNYFNEILRISKNQIIFGGNFYTDYLYVNQCWLVWDKQIPKGFKKAQNELCWTSFKSYSRIYSVLWHGMIRVDNEERFHPTQKPVKLLEKILLDFSSEDDTIMDPFLGSGTTCIAAERIGRSSIGIEISKEYCEISYKRLKEKVRQGKLLREPSTIEKIGF